MSTLEDSILFTFSRRTSTKRIFSIQFASFCIASFSGLWFHAFPHTTPPQGGGGTVLPACCFHMGGAGLKNNWKNISFSTSTLQDAFFVHALVCFQSFRFSSHCFIFRASVYAFPRTAPQPQGGAGRLSTHVTIV